VVAARPDQMYGWPGLASCRNGDLIAVVSERKNHICPYGRIVMSRSSDKGATWALPQEIFNSEMDDRHPSVVALSDGTLVCSFLTVNFWMDHAGEVPDWGPRAARVPQRLLDEALGDWLVRSFDGGRTWEQVSHRMPHGGSLHASPVALSDGSIVCFGYELDRGAVQLHFYSSGDRGESWQRIGAGPAASPVTGKFAWMPWQLARGKEVTTTPLSMRSIVELSPGNLLAVFGGPGGFLFDSRSGDGGRTWSEPRQLSVWGFPPQLLKLRNGALLCSYGHRREPWSVRGVLSHDSGSTWDLENAFAIDQWDDKPDMGYPVVVQTGDGDLAAVYYCSRKPTVPGQAIKDMAPGSSPEGLLCRRIELR
ncbi:MAG: exo-alpha-sialidase, partial [Chloroflexi bacterium]|nr:exo-alpha-sialidase [Chloroflexota bacterium]